MPLLAATADVTARLLEGIVNAPHLQAIESWQHSDCSDEALEPPAWLAVNWHANDRVCHLHEDCLLCHSCAACRPEQRGPDGLWDLWLFLAGRGSGKTRAAAEYCAAASVFNRRWRIAVVAPTYADARDTCIEGESGLQAVLTNWGWEDGREYQWNRSLGELTLKGTGSKFKLFSAEKPARLRGPQHHLAWYEEFAQILLASPLAVDMATLGLRLGPRPHAVATTTPLPLQGIRDALVDPDTVITRGTTDNNASNLAASALRSYHKKYDGKALGRQELLGELLEEVPGALWKRAWLDMHRLPAEMVTGDAEVLAVRLAQRTAVRASLQAHGIVLNRIVIGVDPAVKSTKSADNTGIVVVAEADSGQIYVLEDATLHASPGAAMDRVIECYDWWGANLVILEVNNGGEYIPEMIQNRLELAGRRPHSVFTDTVNAKTGKRARAEPVAALYEPHYTTGAVGTVQHVGTHQRLEDVLCTWQATATESPDEMDALVYAVTHLDQRGTGSGPRRANGQVSRGLAVASARMPLSSVGGRR